jgi:hypothetical protein
VRLLFLGGMMAIETDVSMGELERFEYCHDIVY